MPYGYCYKDISSGFSSGFPSGLTVHNVEYSTRGLGIKFLDILLNLSLETLSK